MNAPFSYVPAFPAVIGWIVGILLWWIGGTWWLALVFVLSGIGLMIRRTHYIAFGLLCVGAGWAIAALNEPNSAPEGLFDGHERHMAATVVESHGNQISQTYYLQIDSIRNSRGTYEALSPFKVQVSALAEAEHIPLGSHIHLNASLEPLQDFADYPWQSDMSIFYLQKGLSASAYIDMDSIEIIGRKSNAKAFCDDRRNEILSLLAHSGLSDDAFGLISALIVAYDDELNPEIKENFRASGIAHALALSGFHVGVIVILISIILLPLRFVPRLRRLRFLISIALIWSYVALVGAPLSVARAAVMVSVFLLGLISERPTNPYNSLCIALLFILAISPFSLFSAGLQLSVSAVLGILAFAKILNPISPKKRLTYKVVGTFTVTIAALLGTMVVTACYFHRLPILFLFSNVFIALLLPILMFGGIILVVIGTLGLHWAFGANIINWLTDISNDITNWIASLPLAEISGIYLSDLAATLLIITCITGAIAVNINNRHGYIALALSLVATVSVTIFTAPAIPKREVCVLRHPTSTALFLREGSTAIIVPTCRLEDLEFVAEKLNRDIEAYAAYSGADSVLITCKDFQFGNFQRSGSLLTLGTTIIGLAPGQPADSLNVDYLLVGRAQRGKPDKILPRFSPDTIILGCDISPRRANQIQSLPTPTINLRHTPWQPKF